MRKRTELSGRWRVLGGIVTAVVAAGSLAACGSSHSSNPGSSAAATTSSQTSTQSSSGSSSSGSGGAAAAAAVVKKYEAAPSTISQTAPLPKAPSKGTIVFINNGEPDTEVIAAGTEAAAKAAGWTYDSISYDATQPASLQSALQNALAKHPTVVTEAGTPQTQFGKSVLARYAAAHVALIPTSTYPVTKTGAIPVTSGDIPNGYTINSDMAKALAAWFVKNSGGKGKALIPDITGYPVLHGVVTGFEQETKKLCPACKVSVLPVSLADVAAGNLVNESVSAVQRTGSTYLIFENGEFGTGAESALKSAGLTNVTVSGLSPQPAQITEVRNGIDEAWVNQGFQYVGWATMDLALRYEQKAPLTTGDSTQPFQLVDTNNAKSVSEQVNIPIPGSGLSQFQKLWKAH
jgi:ribose transport system substrate-binding protein